MNINMNLADLTIINQIVKENSLDAFRLIYTNSSGIGYTIDLEYDTTINNRESTVRIPVCGSENW